MVNAVTGLAYGLTLAAIGLIAAGGGDGCYAPLGLFAAPLSLFGVAPAFFGAPLFWAGVGWLWARGGRWRVRAGVALVLLHYLAAALLARRGPYSDWADLQLSLASAVPGLALYLAGQVVLWRDAFDRQGAK